MKPKDILIKKIEEIEKKVDATKEYDPDNDPILLWEKEEEERLRIIDERILKRWYETRN